MRQSGILSPKLANAHVASDTHCCASIHLGLPVCCPSASSCLESQPIGSVPNFPNSCPCGTSAASQTAFRYVLQVWLVDSGFCYGKQLYLGRLQFRSLNDLKDHSNPEVATAARAAAFHLEWFSRHADQKMPINRLLSRLVQSRALYQATVHSPMHAQMDGAIYPLTFLVRLSSSLGLIACICAAST